MRRFTLILTLISFVLFTGFTIQNEESVQSISYSLTKSQAKLQSQELNHPLEYLSTDIMLKANLILIKEESTLNDAQYISDGYLIEGVVKNSATFSSFKNVVLRVNFHSIDQTIIGSKEYSIPKDYKPNSSTPILLKVYPPIGDVEFDFEIVRASGV